MPLSGRLTARTIGQYLEDLHCNNILRKTLAIAALNALSSLVWDREEEHVYDFESDTDAFDDLEIPTDGKTVVIRALVPMLKRLLKAGADLS